MVSKSSGASWGREGGDVVRLDAMDAVALGSLWKGLVGMMRVV